MRSVAPSAAGARSSWRVVEVRELMDISFRGVGLLRRSGRASVKCYNAHMRLQLGGVRVDGAPVLIPAPDAFVPRRLSHGDHDDAARGDAAWSRGRRLPRVLGLVPRNHALVPALPAKHGTTGPLARTL